MKRIETERIIMRPHSYFVAKNIFTLIGYVLSLALVALFAASITYILKNGLFSEYLSYGRTGLKIFIESIPWLGIVTVLFITADLYLIAQKMGKKAYAIVGILLALLGGPAYGISLNSSNAPSLITQAGMFSSKKAVRITGIARVVSGEVITVDSNGVLKKVKISSSTQGDKNINVGDELLILGVESNGQIEARVCKIIKKAVKKEVKTEPMAVVQPVSEPPKPVPKTTTTKTTTPLPPSAFTKSISLSVVPGGPKAPVLPLYAPRMAVTLTYEITWIANFTSTYGFKVVWSKSANPVYPLRPNPPYNDRFHYFDKPNAKSDYLDSFDGSGKYYVRVCEYLGEVCGVYSNQITLIFP